MTARRKAGNPPLPADRQSAWGWTERLCSRCRDWWPATRDFFQSNGKRSHNSLSRWCGACHAERKRIADARRPAKTVDASAPAV